MYRVSESDDAIMQSVTNNLGASLIQSIASSSNVTNLQEIREMDDDAENNEEYKEEEEEVKEE